MALDDPLLDLRQMPVSDFISTEGAASALGVSRKLIEAACAAYRRRMQPPIIDGLAPDPYPLPHELPCLWLGARPTYLVYRPALDQFRVNRPGDKTGRPGRKAGWRKPPPNADLTTSAVPLV